MLFEIVRETEAEATNVAHVVSRPTVDASHVPTKAELVNERCFTLVTFLRFFSGVAETDVSTGQ